MFTIPQSSPIFLVVYIETIPTRSPFWKNPSHHLRACGHSCPSPKAGWDYAPLTRTGRLGPTPSRPPTADPLASPATSFSSEHFRVLLRCRVRLPPPWQTRIAGVGALWMSLVTTAVHAPPLASCAPAPCPLNAPSPAFAEKPEAHCTPTSPSTRWTCPTPRKTLGRSRSWWPACPCGMEPRHPGQPRWTRRHAPPAGRHPPRRHRPRSGGTQAHPCRPTRNSTIPRRAALRSLALKSAAGGPPRRSPWSARWPSPRPEAPAAGLASRQLEPGPCP